MSVNLCTYSYLRILCFNTTINVILNSTFNCLLLVYRNAVGSLGDGSDGKELAAHYKDLSFTAQLLYKKPGKAVCTCNPSTVWAETGGFWELTDQLF